MADTEHIMNHASEAMTKTFEHLSAEYANVRTGRATGAVLDSITVDYYGVPTPITQVASIKTVDAHTLVVEPWDKSVLKEIESAILKSDLGITPSNTSEVLRLPFPPPTQERRLELVKHCVTLAEETKVAVRNIRHEAKHKIDTLKKNSEISEDEVYRLDKRIQEATDVAVAKIEMAFKTKEAEVKEV